MKIIWKAGASFLQQYHSFSIHFSFFLFSFLFFFILYILRKFNDSDPIILSVLNIHIYYLVHCCHSDFIRVPNFQVLGYHCCFSLSNCKIFVGLAISATKPQQYSDYVVQTWLTQLHFMKFKSIFVDRIMVIIIKLIFGTVPSLS